MANEHIQQSFYKFPKMLLMEEFKELSSDAKIIYMIMLDLEKLSEKNLENFSDNHGVYIFMTIEKIQKLLNCGKNKAIKILKELEQFELIENKKQGQGKPNIIYLGSKNKPLEVSKSNLLKFKNQTSRSLKTKPLEVSKRDTINTNKNNTKNNKTKESKNPPPSFSATKEIESRDYPENLKSKLKDFITYKKQEHRYSYKEMGFKSFLTQLDQARQSNTDEQIIDNIDLSMSNGWKGVYWDKLATRKGDLKNGEYDKSTRVNVKSSEAESKIERRGGMLVV